MELPHIGKHCSEPTCNQLDFLPMTCNLCKKTFCIDHHKYFAHKCTESYRADAQVPICPVCGQVVPSKRDLAPDLAVNNHLENNCQSKAKKIYSNRCSVVGCKTKEVISVHCDICAHNYCLRHRHVNDHNCDQQKKSQLQGGATSSSQAAAAAAQSRSFSWPLKKSSGQPKTVSTSSHQSTSSMQPVHVVQVQGNMSEDEAFARALAASMSDSTTDNSLQNEDEMLAQAMAASLREGTSSHQAHSDNKCNVS